MARPRSSKPQRKGTGTSFGKRTDAEKSYRKKGPSTRSSDGDKRSFGKPSFGKPSGFRKSSTDGGSFRAGKPSFGNRRDSSSGESRSDDRREGGFRPRPEGTGSYSKPPRFGDSGKGSFDGEKRPYRKSSGDGDSRADRPKRFSGEGGEKRSYGADREKRPYGADSGKRPYRKDSGSSSFDKPKRFSSEGGEKKSYGADSGKRPYRKDSSDSSSSYDKPKRFSSEGGEKKSYGADSEKKSFRKSSDDSSRGSGEERGFDKRSSGDESGKRPFRKDSGSFYGTASDRPERDSEFKKPFRKSSSDKRSFGDDRKSFVQSRVATLADFTKPGRKSKTEDVEEDIKGDGLIRLNKYVANSGVGSRREADKLITMGLISVNGVAITELGTKVKRTDVVRYEDKVLKAEKPVYILLNKPKGFITTTDDPQERHTVMGLVAGACKERIYPVGRLDRNTTGLLLLTNDGDLTDKLTHPSYKAKKVYKVELDKPITKNDFQKVQEGVRLEEGKAMVDDVAIISDDGKTVGLEIHIGWNRVVRRIFESLGYDVVKLDRSVYAGLDKKDTPRGQWRFLKPEEVVMLKHFK